jgi:hypothetical protein
MRGGPRHRFENGRQRKAVAIDTSAFRQQGRLTGRGLGRLEIARHLARVWASCAQSSAIMESQPGERPGFVRSEMMPATAWDQDLGFPPILPARMYCGTPASLKPSNIHRGVENRLSRDAHNVETVRSIRTPATNRAAMQVAKATAL